MPREVVMLARKVKVFKNGRSRAIRIPKEFKLLGDELVLRQSEEGGAVMITSAAPTGLIEWLKTLEPIDEQFPEIEDLPAEDVAI
jgi:antitoxin VapB